jgi:hypothetical protein
METQLQVLSAVALSLGGDTEVPVGRKFSGSQCRFESGGEEKNF